MIIILTALVNWVAFDHLSNLQNVEKHMNEHEYICSERDVPGTFQSSLYQKYIHERDYKTYIIDMCCRLT